MRSVAQQLVFSLRSSGRLFIKDLKLADEIVYSAWEQGLDAQISKARNGWDITIK